MRALAAHDLAVDHAGQGEVDGVLERAADLLLGVLDRDRLADDGELAIGSHTSLPFARQRT